MSEIIKSLKGTEDHKVPEDEMTAICVGWWQVYKLSGRGNVLDAETSIEDDSHATLHFGRRWNRHAASFAVSLSKHKDHWYVDSVDVAVTPAEESEGQAYADKWLTLSKLGPFDAQMRKYDKEHRQCA